MHVLVCHKAKEHFMKLNIYWLFLFFIPFTANAQNEGDALFNSPDIHNIEFTFGQPSFWDTLEINYTLDKFTLGDVRINGTLVPDVGIKFKGNSSYNNQSDKKSFKIDMNEFVSGQEFDSLKRLNLNNGFKDPSFLREKLTLDILKEQGLPAPRCTYANLYINGTRWGLYMLVEEVNKKFLDQRFGEDVGNLFKGDPHGNLNWQGPADSAYYNDYELKTNENANDWSDLVNLIDVINNTPGNNFQSELEQVLNTETFIKCWANYVMFVNLDSYLGTGHNYYIYHDSVSDVFEWINWDVNESFGNFNAGMTIDELKELDIYSMPMGNKPLIAKMLNNNNYKTRFNEYLCYLTANVFTSEHLFQKMDSLQSRIESSVYADTKKFFTNSDFDNSLTQNVAGAIPALKPFVTDRNAFVLQTLENLGLVCTTGLEETATENAIAVIPNPFSESTTVYLPEGKKKLCLFDLTGREVFSALAGSGSTYVIQKNNIAAGTYLLSVTLENKIYSQLIIIN
jgi:spore coat protein H